jgi:hypothetical protein
MSSDRDDHSKDKLRNTLAISPRQIADGLAPSLRKHYEDVVREDLPDHLRALIDRIGSEGKPPPPGNKR